MKKKIFIYLLLLLPALTFQSCLKDQEDVFDKDAALRVQENNEKVDTILNSSTYGWIVNYYPSEEQEYGGYAFTFQFKNGKVTVGSELAPGTFEESTYKIKSYRSTTLSFDTYNTLMHFFARPTSDNYEGFHGDVEFAVDSVANDYVRAHGTRNGCILEFRKLQETPEAYLDKVNTVADNFLASTLEAEIGNESIIGTFDVDNRQLTLCKKDGSDIQTTAFAFSDTGVTFYNPFNYGGVEFKNLDYNAEPNTLTGNATDGTAVKLQCLLPADYVKFENFAGDYTFSYYRGRLSCDVKLVPDAENGCYYMTGWNDNYTVKLNYNKSKGCLEMNSQIVGKADNGYNVWLCAWGLGAGGNLTWATDAGMVTQWNMDAENPVYTFVTNSYTGLVTDSFILWYIDNDNNSGGQVSDSQWYIAGGNNQIPYVTGLIKK